MKNAQLVKDDLKLAIVGMFISFIACLAFLFFQVEKFEIYVAFFGFMFFFSSIGVVRVLNKLN